MTALSNQFALIGQRFPVDAFKDLHSATLRTERRPREERRWRPSSDAVVVPPRFA